MSYVYCDFTIPLFSKRRCIQKPYLKQPQTRLGGPHNLQGSVQKDDMVR